MLRKMILFSLAFLTFQPLLQAQFKKGMKMVNASMSTVTYNTGSQTVTFPPPTQGYTTKETSFDIHITPSMGWFISDNTAIGISLNINPSSIKSLFEAGGNTFEKDVSKSFNIGLGGFGRNYFNSSGSYLPFGQLSLNLGMSSQNVNGFLYGGSGSTAFKSTYDGKSSGGLFANATFSLGLTKLVNENTGLDIFAGYTFSYTKSTLKTTTLRDDGNNGSIDVTLVNEPTMKFTNHGFTFGVGFQVFLDAKK